MPHLKHAKLSYLRYGIIAALASVAALVTFINMVPPGTQPWYVIRLWAVFLHARGINPYASSHEGLISGWLYGPVPLWLYAPATWLSTPFAALTAGSVLSSLYLLGPSFLLINGAAKNRTVAVKTLAISCFLLALYFFPYTACLSSVHADAPALGLSALAIYFWRKGGEQSAVFILLAAFCTVAAFACKQSFFSVGLLIPALALHAKKPRPLILYLLGLLAFATLMTLYFSYVFGWENLKTTMFTVPGGTPWMKRLSDKEIVAETTAEKIKVLSSALVIILTGVFSIIFLPLLSMTRKILNKERLDDLWPAFTLLCLFSLPVGAAALARVGGAENSAAPVYFFALLSLTCYVLEVEWPKVNTAQEAFLLAGLALTIVVVPKVRWDWTSRVVQWKKHQETVAYEYLLKEPNRFYFPWNPLAQLMATGHAYHNPYAVHDRQAAKVTISQQQIDNFRPEKRPEGFAYVGLADCTDVEKDNTTHLDYLYFNRTLASSPHWEFDPQFSQCFESKMSEPTEHTPNR